MDKLIISKLEQLNLSSNEARVYSILAGLGQTSAGNIIKEAQLHRSVVYETLDKLTLKKLVFKVMKKKIAYYQITDPAVLLEKVKTQQSIAEELVVSLRLLSENKLPEITIYEGVESYNRYWIESMEKMPENSVDYVAGSIGSRWYEYMGKKNIEKYMKLMVERRIKWKMLVFEENDIEMENLKKYPNLHEYRLIEKNIELAGNFNVFNDDILILHSATEPMVIEIKNKTLIKVFKNIFDIMWEAGKKI